MPTLKVRDLMTTEVVALNPDDDLGTLRDLMVDRHVRHVPVVDADGEIVGLVTHRDLLRSSLIEQADTPLFIEQAMLTRTRVRDVMTADVETVPADADLREAAQIMFENKFGCLPVVEGRRLVGILTEADFVRFHAQGE